MKKAFKCLAAIQQYCLFGAFHPTPEFFTQMETSLRLKSTIKIRDFLLLCFNADIHLVAIETMTTVVTWYYYINIRIQRRFPESVFYSL